MKNLSIAQARAIIDPIYNHLMANGFIQPADQQNLIDAMDHPADSVYVRAFLTVREVQDKTPFETALSTHATNHTDAARAQQAYEAMNNAYDLMPFHRAIQAGVASGSKPIACSALIPISKHVSRTQHIPTLFNRTLIDAASNTNKSIAIDGLMIIEHLKDKAPFESVLLACAADHKKPDVAIAALEATGNANDMKPYAMAIDMASQSKDPSIVKAGLKALSMQALINHAIPAGCEQALIRSLNHHDYEVVRNAHYMLSHIHDISPFTPALQQSAQQSNWGDIRTKAQECLKKMGNTQQPNTQTATTQKSAESSPIKDVRLNFNIAKNGSGIGPDAHLHDSVKALSALFDKSASVWAEVFYDPNSKLAEGSLIEVELPKNYRDAVLTDTLAGRAPAMTVRQRANGKYFATLTT